MFWFYSPQSPLKGCHQTENSLLSFFWMESIWWHSRGDKAESLGKNLNQAQILPCRRNERQNSCRHDNFPEFKNLCSVQCSDFQIINLQIHKYVTQTGLDYCMSGMKQHAPTNATPCIVFNIGLISVWMSANQPCFQQQLSSEKKTLLNPLYTTCPAPNSRDIPLETGWWKETDIFLRSYWRPKQV